LDDFEEGKLKTTANNSRVITIRQAVGEALATVVNKQVNKIISKAQGDSPAVPPPGLVWLETNTCDGHIISFCNSRYPPLRQTLEQDFIFYYAPFLMAAEGENALCFLDLPEINEGSFILVVEGTVPTAFGGRTALLGKIKGRDVTAMELVKRLGSRARWVVAAGTCASFGGPYAARPNPTASLPLSQVLSRQVIKLPGCPVHPGWILETLKRLKYAGKIKLDAMGRPLFLYGTTVHSLCERLPLYEAGCFAEKPGDEGCLYLLGCKGPVTRADCPRRRWIEEKSNWPVGVNTPCIGCTAPEYPDGVAPFFKHHADLYTSLKRVNAEKIGAFATVFTFAGIAFHLTGKLITGRLKPRIPGVLKKWPGKKAGGLRKALRVLRLGKK